MNERPPRPHLGFGPFSLDPESGELRRNGRPVPLRPKATAVLVELVGRSGNLVPRGDLLEAAWGDAHLDEDAALHKAISEIRHALGDTAGEPRYVETVHRRGYRFVAEVRDAGEIPAAEGEAREREPAETIGPRASFPSDRLRGPLGIALLVLAVGAGVWSLRDATAPAERNWLLETPAEVLRARRLTETRRASEIVEAARILRAAVREEPNPLAWSGLAETELELGRFEAAREAADRALDLHPLDADAHRILGQLAVWDGELAEAEKHLLRARELAPMSPEIHHAWALYLAAIGRSDEAVATADRARALDEGKSTSQAGLSRFLLYSRDYARAAREARAFDEVDDPIPGVRLTCHQVLQVASWMTGDHEATRAALLDYMPRFGLPSPLAEEASRLPPAEGAERLLRWLGAYYVRSAATDPAHYVEAILVHAQLGELDTVARLIDLLVASDYEPGALLWLQDPRLDPVRDTPAFDRLVALGSRR